MSFEVEIEKSFGGSAGFRLSVSFCAQTGRLALFGPSGSGKSLTLMAMAGLLRPGAGRIRAGSRVFFDSARGVNVLARKRNTGFLFQDYALFPHMNVRDNVAFGLHPPFGRLTRTMARAVEDMLERFGIASLARLLPSEISGGQRQRVALARAVIREPEALLLDEPFSALDVPLRAHVRQELNQIVTRLGIPFVLVTHDPEDARVLAYEVAEYEKGTVTGVKSANERFSARASSNGARHAGFPSRE